MKAAAYEIARKEAQEVRAVLRRLVIARALTTKHISKAYNLADCIIGMLTTMIGNLKERNS